MLVWEWRNGEFVVRRAGKSTSAEIHEALFGAGATRGNATYARLEGEHEILRGFGDTNWIAGGEFWIPVRTTDEKTEAALSNPES